MESRNSRCRPSLVASARSSADRAAVSSAASADAGAGSATPRSPAASFLAAWAVSVNGLVSHRARLSAAIPATRRPTSRPSSSRRVALSRALPSSVTGSTDTIHGPAVVARASTSALPSVPWMVPEYVRLAESAARTSAVRYEFAAPVAVAVLVTGAITVPLTRTSTVQGEQERLSAQADLLASLDRLPVKLTAANALINGTRFAVVESPPNGRVTGAANSYLTAEVRAALSARGTYSGTTQGTLGRALVEARAATAGPWIVSVLPVTELGNALNKATQRVLLGLLVGLLVAGVAALSLARWLTKPLTETAHAARKLAAGERGVALPAPASAEAAELTAALSALDRALATSEGRQREFLL